MFNKVYNSQSSGAGIDLAFIKSLNVQVFPCGRRRAQLSNGNYVPFDPEARLNTEKNNINHSSINGFTQTYLNSFEDEKLSLVLAGYLFNITLTSGYTNPSVFGNSLTTLLSSSEAASIYANIRIEETELFSNCSTKVLRAQAPKAEDTPACLDIIVDTDDSVDDSKNYYFSGLSFSTKPLADASSTATWLSASSEGGKLLTVSLKILEKIDNEWQIHQPALLPDIKHGAEENSVELGKLAAESVNTNQIKLLDNLVYALDVVPKDGDYQLKLISKKIN